MVSKFLIWCAKFTENTWTTYLSLTDNESVLYFKVCLGDYQNCLIHHCIIQCEHTLNFCYLVNDLININKNRLKVSLQDLIFIHMYNLTPYKFKRDLALTILSTMYILYSGYEFSCHWFGKYKINCQLVTNRIKHQGVQYRWT